MKRIIAGALTLAVLGTLVACESKGPAERAGQSFDKAGQNVRDTLDPPKGPAESAGRSIDRALSP